jgi:hypothetical protein
MNDLVVVDAWLLLGAVAQLILVLRARNFYLEDWLVPVGALLGVSLGWYFFIYLCSGNQGAGPAAETFIIGFGMGVCLCGIYVSAFAPLRLNPTTLLSLTISFWAVYAAGGSDRRWLIPALVMTAAALLYAAGAGRDSLAMRAGLQFWSLSAAALVAWNSIPASVGNVIGDYRAAELAHTLDRFEILVSGAQAFLFAQMGSALILMIFEETWSGWLPKRGEDGSLRWPAVAALVVQAAAFVLLRRSGGAAQSHAMALAVFAALAHGAMTGPDASSDHPDVDFDLDARS